MSEPAVRWTAAPHPALLPLEALIRQCRMTPLRRSGPGGQHRNKVSTAVRWYHEPSGVTAEASESRDQARNRREGMTRLRLRLAIRLRTEPQAALTDPVQQTHRQRLLPRKLKVSAGHEDYPAVLALVLDDLHQAGGQPSQVGPQWNASTTAVVSLVAAQPAALQEVNRWRQEQGRGPLHRPSG